MKRTLLLLRHAKSDWNAPHEDDHERPLAPRGVRAAGLVGRFLARTGPQPDLAIASDAVRTRETLRLAQEAGLGGRAEQSRDLYLASARAVESLAQSTPGEVECLLLTLHEPTVSELVQRLSGARVRIPTAALARLDFDADRWQNLQPGACTLRWLVTPKLLGAAFGNL